MQKTYYQDLEKKYSSWLFSLGYRKATVYNYGLHLKELLEYRSKEQRPLNKSLLESFIIYLNTRPNKRMPGGLSSTSLQGKYNSIRLFLEYLKLMEGINIMVQLPIIKRENSQRQALSFGEVERLYKVIDQEKEGLTGRAIMAIYYGCGLRRSEGRSLVIQDLFFKTKMLRVREGKGGKQRYVPMSEGVIKDLKNYIYECRYAMKKGNPDFVFVSKRRNQLSPSSYDRRLAKWRKESQIKAPLSLHVLRHSIATHLLDRGMTMDILSQFLGHASLLSTQVYTHLLKKNDEEL